MTDKLNRDLNKIEKIINKKNEDALYAINKLLEQAPEIKGVKTVKIQTIPERTPKIVSTLKSLGYTVEIPVIVNTTILLKISKNMTPKLKLSKILTDELMP